MVVGVLMSTAGVPVSKVGAVGAVIRSWPGTAAVEDPRFRAGGPLLRSPLFQDAERKSRVASFAAYRHQGSGDIALVWTCAVGDARGLFHQGTLAP